MSGAVRLPRGAARWSPWTAAQREICTASEGDALPPLHRPPLRVSRCPLFELRTSTGLFQLRLPCQNQSRRLVEFWSEPNFTLGRAGVGRNKPGKCWLNITCSILICCHLLTKIIWYLQLPLNFIPIVAEIGGGILIYFGAERELFFRWHRNKWVFWTTQTPVRSNLLSQVSHWSKNALGSQSLGC